MKSAHNSPIEMLAIRGQDSMIDDVVEENENEEVQGSRPFSVGSNGEARFPTKSEYSSSSSNHGEKTADSITSTTSSNTSAPPAHMLTPQSSCSSSYPSPPENIARDNPPILQSSFQMTPILHSL